MRSSHVTLHTFLALLGTVIVIGGLGTVVITQRATNEYIEIQNAANERHAVRLAEFVHAQLDARTPPSVVRDRLQMSLAAAPFDSSGFLCLLDAHGVVVCHPDPNAVGMQMAGAVVRRLDGVGEGTLGRRAAERRGGPGILNHMTYAGASHLIFQEPVPGQPWLVSVHSNLDLLRQHDRDFARAMVLAFISVAFFVVLLGTFAARGVARKYEREIERADAALEVRVAERTRELSRSLEELRSARAKLLQKEKMALVGQLMAGLTHELNNPLTTIIGRAQLGMMRSRSEESKTALEEIHAAGVRCSNLVC